jgi:hypothetical protein
MAYDEDGLTLPWFADGVAWHGMVDFDDRVLAWLGSVSDGADAIKRTADGKVVPFIVLWLWNQPDAVGDPGGGWEYKTAAAARKRFVAEVAKAAEEE